MMLLLLLVSGGVQDLEIRIPKNMNQHKCKVMCQRFGMKALGPEFASIHNPTECCTKCDEVYKKESAFLQLRGLPKTAPSTQNAQEPVKVPTQVKGQATET